MSLEKTDNNYLHNETVAEIAGGFSGNSYWEWFPYIGKFRYCRDFAGMLGYGAGDLPNSFSGWLRIVHPEERRQVTTSLKQLIRRKEPVSYECRFKSRSGQWKWIHTRIRSFENGDGAKGIRLVGVNTCIDREKQFEADLDLNKKRLDLLFQNIHQGIMLEDHNRKILYVNRFFRQMFGIPKDLNVAGMDCRATAEQSSRLFKDPPGFLNGINRCIDSGESLYGEELILADGRIFERDYLPVGGRSKEFGSFWLYRDVTEKKAYEKKINEVSEQNLLMAEMGMRLISSDTPDQVFRYLFNQLRSLLPEFAVIIVKTLDTQTAGIFDYTFPDKSEFTKIPELLVPVLKKKVFTIIPDTAYLYNPQKLSKVKGGVAELIEPLFPRVLVSKAKRLLAPNDVYTIGISVRNVYFGNVNIIAPKGEYKLNRSFIEAFVYQCAIAISQLYNQQELVAAREKAEEGSRLKSAFLANISHEIRTPMNGIVGFADLLKTPGLDSNRRDRYVDTINSSAKVLLGLINDILDISRIESGDKSVLSEEVNIEALFTDLKDMFELNNKDVDLIFSPGKIPRCLTDRLKLTQVLINLVGNALKFTSSGYVRCSAGLKKGMIRFCIKDTGSGIKEDDQEIIFERFVQGEHKVWNSLKGAGLGLSITKAYVEMMGGSIWFESEWGKGSKFYFTIPYKPAG